MYACKHICVHIYTYYTRFIPALDPAKSSEPYVIQVYSRIADPPHSLK